MSHPLSILPSVNACWQEIGVWGNRSCPELNKVTHCHNCPVFAAAGRRFLDAPSPPNYLEEWTARLGMAEDDEVSDEISVLVFRLSEEWLALPVEALTEVAALRAIHKIPHRGGLLSGMANIRGELHLCIRLDLLLGTVAISNNGNSHTSRLIVIQRNSESWAFTADEVDQVYRISLHTIVPAAPTLSRAAGKMNKGVFTSRGHTVGLLDEVKLFHAIREQTR